jgi:hypothetical protein
MAYCRHLADFPPKDELEPLIDFIRSPQLHPPGIRSWGGGFNISSCFPKFLQESIWKPRTASIDEIPDQR